MKITWINPAELGVPRGYSNGVVVRGATLYVAGQIGWNAQQVFETDDIAGQWAQALDNVLTIVRAAGGTAESVVKMTIYVTDLDAYRSSLMAFGAAWRKRFGKHFPTMALVGVSGLVEQRAKIEIETIAVVPDEPTAP
jgi:enamine deaminase RidA (YjgF/YER057c/UK114 family)